MRLISRVLGPRLSFLIINFLCKLRGLNDLQYKSNKKLGTFGRKLLDRKLRLEYQEKFKSLCLVDAYRLRVKLFLFYESGLLSSDKKAVRRYFSIIFSDDYCSALNLDLSTKKAIKEAMEKAIPVPINFVEEKKYIQKCLVLGPSANPAEVDLQGYDLVVVNKPLPDEFKIDSDRILLILNNQWSIQKKASLLKWLSNRSDARVIGPQDLNANYSRHPIFDQMPEYPSGASLMGLQRTLFILERLYEFGELAIQGFDFSLSENPYKSWYPSLIKKNYGTFSRGLIDSNATHDLILNVMYVRNFCKRHPELTGKIRDISSSPVADIISQFESLRGKGK